MPMNISMYSVSIKTSPNHSKDPYVGKISDGIRSGGVRVNCQIIKSAKKIFNAIRKIGKMRGCNPSPTMIGAASSRFKAAMITNIESAISVLRRI